MFQNIVNATEPMTDEKEATAYISNNSIRKEIVMYVSDQNLRKVFPLNFGDRFSSAALKNHQHLVTFPY